MPGTRMLGGFTALVALFLWTGCAPSTQQVERGLERELPRAIGPADHYEVDIEGLRARSGEAARVSVTGEGVRPEGAPVLDRLDLELRGVKYNRRQERLERVESTQATARILPDALAAFLEEHPNVREASVALREPDQATVRIRPSVGGLDLPRGITAEVTGQLVSEEGQVNLVVSEVRAIGANLGDAAARRLSQTINPLVDLSDTPANLRVTGVRVEDDAVLVEATGDPSGLRLR